MAEGLLCGAENLEFFVDGITLFDWELTSEDSLLVIGATVVHPDTSRTRSLRLSAPMVLGGRPPGRVGHRQETFLFNIVNLTLS